MSAANGRQRRPQPGAKRQGQARIEWAVALLLAALAFALAASGWTWRADRVVYDFGLASWRRPPPSDIVIVAIDDASIDAIGRWPWPRAVHSTLLEQVAQARPRAIALDLLLSEADPDPAQDQLLAQVLRRAAPVVMPVAWQAGSNDMPARLLAPTAAIRSAVLLGAAEAAVDSDGVLRHAFLHTGLAGAQAAVFPHMALALLQAAGQAPHARLAQVTETEGQAARGATTQARKETAGDGTHEAAKEAAKEAAQEAAAPTHPGGGQRFGRFLIRYAGPPGHFKRLSYVDVLRGAVPPQALAGRDVLIGMTAQGLGDTLATPVNGQQHAMAGVEVLANTLYTLRSGDTVWALPPGPAAALAAAWVLLLVLAFAWVGTRGALVLALVSVPLSVGLSLLALGAGVWWPPLPCALATALAYPLWSWRRLERAVHSLDQEIRRLLPEGGLQPQATPAALPARGTRGVNDHLASRLDTLQVATQTVRSARRFLADALAGLPTAMLVTDKQGRVLLANALTAQLFEAPSATDLQGLDLAGLLVEFSPAQPVDWPALLRSPDAAPAGLVVEAQLARLGDFLLHFASVELLGQQRWIVTLADVTAIKQAQRRRDETLAFITHDLRSPASAIMLLAELHLRGQAGTPHHTLLSEIHRLAARALALSDDIVRVAHADSRPLNLAAVGLADLLAEALADWQPQADSANVQLQAVPHAPQSPWLMDRALVLRALGNLLSNAIKHSPRGGAVEVRTARLGPELVFSVADRGPGLSAAQRHKLQTEAQGLPAGDARGVGLGLLFVQRVAARHGGRLLAQAGAGGVGTVFALHLQEPVPAAPPT